MQCSNPFLTFFINYNNVYLYDLYDNFVIYKYYVYVYCTYTTCVLKKHRVFIARSNDYFSFFSYLMKCINIIPDNILVRAGTPTAIITINSLTVVVYI